MGHNNGLITAYGDAVKFITYYGSQICIQFAVFHRKWNCLMTHSQSFRHQRLMQQIFIAPV